MNGKVREILFRGIRCDNGEWCYGSYVEAKNSWHGHGRHKEWIVTSARANGGWFAMEGKHAVVADTVGQYTGMTDRYGVKIFEGDVVKARDALLRRDEPLHEFVGTIGFKHASFMIESDCLTHYRWMDYEVEVIGSIHDKKGVHND